MTEKIYNRPSIDGTPVEGPIPFTDVVTIVDIMKIGGNPYGGHPHLSALQIAHLAAFRKAHPVSYDADGQSVEYPPEAFDYPAMVEGDSRKSKELSFGRIIINHINRLTGRIGEQHD